MSKVTQALNMYAENQSIKAKDLVKKLKVTSAYAYVLLSKARKQYSESPAGRMKDKPKARMQASEAQVFEHKGEWVEKKSALLMQVGGDHYKGMEIQPMVYSMANKLDPCQHTIIKYVSRFRDKGGIADLEKAKHVIEMLIEFESAK